METCILWYCPSLLSNVKWHFHDTEWWQ